LSGREELFRLSGAVKRDPAVERWLSSGAIELKSIARQWFKQIRKCGADVRELMNDGCPVACGFRPMPATGSGPCRSMIPEHAGPPFRPSRATPCGACFCSQ
jgi:hypothetical protein